MGQLEVQGAAPVDVVLHSISVAGGALQNWLMSSDLHWNILYGMGALLVVAVAFFFWRYNSGKVDMEVSYEAN